MATEIERKYLVDGSGAWRTDADDGTDIVQGYLSIDPERTVRVRLKGDDGARLTIKGPSDGPSRAEFEYDIPPADGEALLELCRRPLVEKTRYRVDVGGLTWEVDVFRAANDGLVLAEVELDDAATEPQRPPWVTEDVTHDEAYYNVNLVERPFSEWGGGC